MSERVDPDYRSLFEQLPGLFLVLEPDRSFTIVDASDAYLRATFTTREDLVGRGLFDVLPKEPVATRGPAAAKLRRSLDTVISTGRPDPMPVQRFDVFRPPEEGGGTVERFWSAVNAPVHSRHGRLLYIVHSIADVTEFVHSSREMQTEDDALRLEILQRGRQLAAANRQLREVVSQFRAIYDQGIFAGRLDLDGNLIEANRSSLEQCGYTATEVIGKPFWECGWWNRSLEVQTWVKNAIEHALGGETFRGISVYYRADGTERIVDFACMPIKDEYGNVMFLFVTGMDITERVSAERNLRAMHILESITQGFFALDPEWRFTYVNREAQRILRRAPNELIGKRIWTEYPGMRGSRFEAAFRRAMGERVTPDSVTAYYPDHARWYEMQTYPAAEGIAVYFRDVTEQMEAQAERARLAAESEQLRRMYEAALSSTPDLVYVVDVDKRFTYANEALLKMLGKRREDVIGRDCLELGYPPWHAETHAQEIDHVIATRLTVRSEVPFTAPEGRRVYDYILVPVVASDGSVSAVAGTARDITHRKAAEQAIREHADALRAADRAKDEFLATLAHELRNPLAPLRSALHLLGTGGAEASAPSLIELMERQLDHLIRLVDDLLEMSRITRGTFALRKERIQVADVVRNAVETSRPLIEAAHHELTVTLPEEPLWLEGDPVRLAQIVANLLNNAARYTEDRGRIIVRAEKRGDAAEISVIDTGIGIDPETLPRVFEMFRRGTDSAMRGGGLGIGLSLSQRLVAMHGGTIEAHSAGTGAGSRFVVRLPLAEAPEGERPAAAGGSASVAGPEPLRILIVDDNRDAAVTLAMILESFGAETEVACSGAEALEKFAAWSPAIVFLDIGMPLIDGYEVARRIRRDFPDRRPTLVALTGWGQQEDRRRAREAGFDHHIVKPAEIGVLRDLVSTLSRRGTSIATREVERRRD